MSNYEFSPNVVYINSDGSIVGILKAELDAPVFLDYGDYLIPFEWVV